MLKERTNRWARLKLLLAVPVMAGALYVFAQPEVKRSSADRFRLNFSKKKRMIMCL